MLSHYLRLPLQQVRWEGKQGRTTNRNIYIDRYKYIHIYKQIDIEIERSFYYCLVYLCLFNSCTGDYSGDIFSAPLWSVLLLFSLSLSLSLYLTLTLFPRGNLENIPINIHIILHWYVHRWIER